MYFYLHFCLLQVSVPEDPISQPEDRPEGEIIVNYFTLNLTMLKAAMEPSNYCTQDVLFFCVAAVPTLDHPYGIFSDDHRLLPRDDYVIRDLAGNGRTSCFVDVCLCYVLHIVPFLLETGFLFLCFVLLMFSEFYGWRPPYEVSQ